MTIFRYIKTDIRSILTGMIGCFLVAIGVYNFAVMAEFPMSGFMGVALIVNRLVDIPLGITFALLNIPVALLCYRLLGKRFFFLSVWFALFLSVTIDYVAPLLPTYGGDRLLAALATGVIAGVGFSLIYMQNTTTGGSDFIVMSIKAVRPHLQLGKIIFCIDFTIILIGGLIFWDIDGIFFGVIITFIVANIVDRLLYRVNAGKLLLIVTDDAEPVRDVIFNIADRGCTIWDVSGGFQGDGRKMVMCACDKTQMYKLQKAVETTDPRAFTVIVESSEVAGQGFRRLVVGERQPKKKIESAR